MLICLDVYHSSFPNEPKLYRAVVYIVYAIETLCVILSAYDLGQMFIDLSYYPYLSYWVVSLCGAIGVTCFLRFEAEAENLKRCC